MGGKISSTQYEMEFVTAQLALLFGTQVVIRQKTFRVLDNLPLDDGTFSRARLQS
jgi:hypothetical protein